MMSDDMFLDLAARGFFDIINDPKKFDEWQKQNIANGIKSPFFYLCPVCGYYMQDVPANHNICCCCGTEFGLHDASRTHKQLRQNWIKTGMKWWSTTDAVPPNWNPKEQLARVK